MEGSFSPIVRKIASEYIPKSKGSFTSPKEVCLEDWWLSRPKNEEGIAVSGRPTEIRKFDDAATSFTLASPMRRYASREFHSAKVVKRHGATMLETCDGSLISLCGFINKSRTQKNGFTSEVCRDFIYGFPFNWDDYIAQSVDEELKSNEAFIESFTQDVLDSCNGAQLHDLVLSLTDTERDLFIERINNNIVLKPEAELGLDKLPKPSRKSVYSLRDGSSKRQCVLGMAIADKDVKASKKQRLDKSMDVQSEQDSNKR